MTEASPWQNLWDGGNAGAASAATSSRGCLRLGQGRVGWAPSGTRPANRQTLGRCQEALCRRLRVPRKVALQVSLTTAVPDSSSCP